MALADAPSDPPRPPGRPASADPDRRRRGDRDAGCGRWPSTEARGEVVDSPASSDPSFDDVFAALVAASRGDAAPPTTPDEDADAQDGRGGGMRGLVTMVQRCWPSSARSSSRSSAGRARWSASSSGRSSSWPSSVLGYGGFRRPLETVVVVPPGSSIPTDAESYQKLAGAGLHIAGRRPGRRRPRKQGWPPARPMSSSSPRPTPRRSSRPASSRSSRSSSTPSTRSAPTTRTSSPRTSSSAVNQAIITPGRRGGPGSRAGRRRAERGQDPAGGRRGTDQGRARNVAPSEPHVLAFYGPAVLALILQHLAITLIALALVRERTSGVIELFRVGAGQRRGGHRRQGPRLPAHRRAHRGDHPRAAHRRVRVPMLGDPVSLAAAHRAAPPRLARDRPGRRRHLRLRAPGRPAVAAAAPRLGLLQRVRRWPSPSSPSRSGPPPSCCR